MVYRWIFWEIEQFDHQFPEENNEFQPEQDLFLHNRQDDLWVAIFFSLEDTSIFKYLHIPPKTM